MRNDIIIQDTEEIYGRNIDWEVLRNSTVLITGSNGMLASYVVYMLLFLNLRGYRIRIIAMARSAEKFFDRFGDFSGNEGTELLTDSITEPIKINHDIDYIIHAASLASPQYYDVCPVDVLSQNVIGTYHLLNLAVEKHVKGFLLFSTGDVYGKLEGIEYVTERDMGIVDPLNIHSCYSESKRMAETMCYAYMHQYHVPVNMIRIFHTYAPTMDVSKDPRVFASFMKNVMNGQNIEIKSDGTGKRAFCYIADAVAGFFLVLTKGKRGEAYNLCNTEQFVSVRELAEILATLAEPADIRISWKKRNANEHYTENRAAGQIAPSNAKLKALDWETKYSIKDGFKRTLEYLREAACILRSPTAASAVANGSRAALSGSGNATRSSAAAGAGPTAAERW